MKLICAVLFKLLVLSKSEWVEITQISTRTSTENLKPATIRPPENSNRRIDDDIDVKDLIPYGQYGLTTFIPDLTSNSSSQYDQQQQATLESTITVTEEQTTENSVINVTQSEEVDDAQDYSSSYPNSTAAGYNGFVSFMTTIQNSLVGNTKKTIKSKLNLLRNLRDNLLYEIQERMNNLWKPKEVSRQARGHHYDYDDDDDHHMDFPSHEGALMTISFLTFAVYLIKLVMKLIHALKSKTQVMTTTVSPMATSIIIGRRKREVVHDEAARILQLIEEYSII